MTRRRKRLMALVGLCAMTALAVVIGGAPVAGPKFLGDRELTRALRARWRGAQYVGSAGMIHQPRRNDCGATCLKMVLDSRGKERDLLAIETELQTTERGTSLRNLRVAAEKMGLSARSWKLAPADLAHAPLPVIAFINGDHFVVVRRFLDSESLEVDDPALGRLHWPVKSFCKRWTGEALVFDGAWQPRRL